MISVNWRASSACDWAVKRRRPLSISDAVTEAVITARSPIPASITTVAMKRPLACIGVTSPYPTVVTVCSASHRPLPSVGYS